LTNGVCRIRQRVRFLFRQPGSARYIGEVMYRTSG
jgi:hypothetical protein